MIFNIPLQNKQSEMRTNSCTIDKVVELSQSEYAAFYQDLLDEYDFIKENTNDLHRDESGINHGLLVLSSHIAISAVRSSVTVLSATADSSRHCGRL